MALSLRTLVKSASASAGGRVFDFTGAFRAEAEEAAPFFESDGHLNQKGHEVFARLLAPALGATCPRPGEGAATDNRNMLLGLRRGDYETFIRWRKLSRFLKSRPTRRARVDGGVNSSTKR